MHKAWVTIKKNLITHTFRVGCFIIPPDAGRQDTYAERWRTGTWSGRILEINP
jgi:hypothetical protein